MTSRLKQTFKNIVAIGTSTGGPRALQVVLSQFPQDIRAPIVVVQHMPPKFTKSLAARLNLMCAIDVKEADNNELLRPGTAYIAPGGKQMIVEQIGAEARTKLLDTPPVNGHRPSVNVLFNSISNFTDYHKVAVVMTGMGSDGATGIQNIKMSGDSHIIAESEKSCIVYGMPKAAIATQMVDSIVELNEIAKTVMNHIK